MSSHLNELKFSSYGCYILASEHVRMLILGSYVLLSKVKSCYNPLRLGTAIVCVFSGIDFVNTPRLYSDRATR